MIHFCIKNNNPRTICYFMEQLAHFPIDSVIYTQKQFSKYTNIILHDQGSTPAVFYDEVSDMICHCILEIYEPIILHHLLISEYFYFDIEEIHLIERNCKMLLQFSPQSHNYWKRVSFLKKAILDYISTHKSILLDGFIQFRIKNYLQILEETLENAINQFVIDREYHDFINLVKLYVESKPFFSDTIYLVYHQGESTLFDTHYEVIQTDKEVLNMNYLSDISFSSNDYTLNSLLTLLPQKLIILIDSCEDEFIQTLKLIFTGRVELKYV